MATVHLLRPAQSEASEAGDHELALVARAGQVAAQEQLFRRHSNVQDYVPHNRWLHAFIQAMGYDPQGFDAARYGGELSEVKA
ncbi:MAG TPA: hypothetical protein VHB79_11580 [Polyangiaceae bacterium]|nr:hypothetical protein [Polyangiaceae bacterium]